MKGKRHQGRFVALFAAAVAVAAIALPASASAKTSPRIVGGQPASIATYPWQAAVVYDGSRFSGNDAQRQLCGGVLVTPRIVLTAAHCIFDTDPDILGGDLDPNDVDVVLNETTLSTGSGEHHDVQATAYQAGYNPALNTNDVGYLVMSTPTSMPPLKLQGPTETALHAPGYPTQVSGYGVLTPSSSSSSNTLRAATVPIVADPTCSGSYGSQYVPGAMICAGYLSGGVDSCFGDSGGPLQAPAKNGVYRLIGIVSFGEGPTGCADAGFPGVYSRVAAGSPGWLHSLVVSDVAGLESAFGLGHTDIVGTGAESILETPRKKCKKHKKLNKKTGKCVKKKKKRKRHKRA